MDFTSLPSEPEPAASSITEFQAMLLEWDTTPRELKEDGEKSLGGFAKARGFSPQRAMKEMEKDNYKLARRQLSIEKGELSHKVRAILDVAYEQALKGNKDARRDWLTHYRDEVKPAVASTPATPDPEPEGIPLTVDEMSDEQLAKKMEEWAE